MNSQVIKFVAGGGKTSFSLQYLKNNNNGLYLAFNNSVVNSVNEMGLMARTIDGFLHSYIIPRFTSQIPLIADGSEIRYCDQSALQGWQKSICNIHIHSDGSIFNKSSFTGFSLSNTNVDLQKYRGTNEKTLRLIFNTDTLLLTDSLRAELSDYLLNNYKDIIIDIVKARFDYLIVDEAQDLRESKEMFAKSMFESELPVIVLGDDNQNINGGGTWFLSLNPDYTQNYSYRSPEGVCRWIRENLNIDIYGNEKVGIVSRVCSDDVLNLDDGNRTLLYTARQGSEIKRFSNEWKGPQYTIKAAKGKTIDSDIVIVGHTMNKRFLYTALTRTTRNAYITIEDINE